MLPSTQMLTHQLIEQTVQVGDIVIDGTTANGVNTRFLATRVGNSGNVLSYTATKGNANAAAASLFMSGLSDRVTFMSKTIDAHFTSEIGLQNQASVAIFDYSEDAQNSQDIPDDFLDQIDRVLLRLTHSGLLIVKFKITPTTWHDYQQTLLPADFKQANYHTNDSDLYLIERI